MRNRLRLIAVVGVGLAAVLALAAAAKSRAGGAATGMPYFARSEPNLTMIAVTATLPPQPATMPLPIVPPTP